MKQTKVAIYARVSTTKEQSTAMQLADLNQLVEIRGWEISREYVDEGMSGAKDNRPALLELMADAVKGHFSIVLVWRFDRFARSTQHLLRCLETFRALEIDFISRQESIDTSTPIGKVLFTLIAAIAEFERALTLERVHAGLEYANKHGTKSGKPIGHPKKKFNIVRARQLREEEGLSWRELEEATGVPKSTLQRRLGEDVRRAKGASW